MDKILKEDSPKLRGAREIADRIRILVVGREADKGLLFKILIYFILIETAFVYVNPLFYMISMMIQDLGDLINPSVIWVPTGIYWGHLQEAWTALDYPKSFAISLGLSTWGAVTQVVFCAMAGYAFARLQFPLKKTLFVCLIFTFILPQQVTVLPLLLLYRQVEWLNTFWPLILPSLFGHGLKGALYVIIFRQFFSVLPKELEEAAKIDGASVYRLFFRVMFPIARPAIVVVFLFSFVWNWNDYYVPGMILFSADDVPMSLSLARTSFADSTEEGQLFGESLDMASTFLAIMPPLLLYLFTQRWFVEGVERTGLVE